MHVPSNRPGRPRRSRHRSLVVTWVLALAGLAGIAQAAEFDEKLSAPMMKSTAEFKTQAQAFTRKFLQIRETSPEQLLTNASLAKQQFDLTWQVQHAIDTKRSLGDLADLGFVSLGDGSYSIDMDAHPEWLELPSSVITVLLPDNLENTIAGLVQRGFRPADVAVLREYVAKHDYNGTTATGSLPLSLGFSRAVKRQDNAKQAIPDSLVFSFWYQRMRVRNEAERYWAAGLVNSFDAQRQRILLSIVMETKASSVWMPDDIASGIPELLTLMRRADYEQRAIAEANGVAP